MEIVDPFADNGGAPEDEPERGGSDPLPPDIEAIWGGGKLDGSGQLAADTARYLIEQWGLETFRRSKLHELARMEAAREQRVRARPKKGK